MNILKVKITALLAICVLFSANIVLADNTEIPAACKSLVPLNAEHFRVEAQQWVGASTLSVGPGGMSTEVPAHCLFRFVLNPRPSNIEGVSFGTGIELRLPQKWNGRLLFQGGGGLRSCGSTTCGPTCTSR